MAGEDAREIFHRINDVEHRLGNKIDTLRDIVTASVAHCDQCRPIVIGNGKPPIGDRVARLETIAWMRGKVDFVLAGAVGSIIAVMVGWLPHVLKWW